jgi:diaminohydroxyphosphoribosylaminopyrimidine deaminase / 5-amino-6-(5-phosphoribosylamino)uracil reductase
MAHRSRPLQLMMTDHTLFMRRCLDLAARGATQVAPNPMVGAVIVHDGRIIGEGWHQRYGEAHAEVNAVASVRPEHRHLLPESTLYCTLEPCHHFGKTPPCVELVLRERFRTVVIAQRDPNPLVAGQSVGRMQAAGITVIEGVLEAAAARLNRVFLRYITSGRPFITLKWAESMDHQLGLRGQRTAISGPLAQRLVHQWRAESGAILVGTNTALTDRPRLDHRLYPLAVAPPHPLLRVALDLKAQIPLDSPLLDDAQPTLILGPTRSGAWHRTEFIPVKSAIWIEELLLLLHQRKRSSLLVEGGADVLRQFMEPGLWDEIRVIQNPRLLGDGIKAPDVPDEAMLIEKTRVGEDWVSIWGR